MPHKLFAALGASLLLSLGSSSTLAIGFCDRFPVSPFCLGEDLPVIGLDRPISFDVRSGAVASIDFAEVSVGNTSAAISVTLTNTGTSAFGPINIFGGAPPTAEFNASQNCQGITLAPQASCSVNYTFSPGATGVFNDASSFTISATPNQSDGQGFTLVLTGTGVDPGGTQPPAEPPAPSFSHELTGSAKVKGEDFKNSQAYSLQMNFDVAALTFLATDADGTLYSGNLAPKGKKGNKFSLFLDDGSSDALSADVAARGAAASGRTAGSVLGESSKLTLKLLPDSSVSLTIKSAVLVSGIGEVVFKANLAGAAPE